MKLKILFIFILFPALNYSFAQNITPVQVERSQEILQKEKALRQKIEQPEKVFVKEIILPQGCLIPKEEVKQITCNFAGYWHSLKEIQELLNVLAKAYQKAGQSNNPPRVSYSLEESRLIVYFN